MTKTKRVLSAMSLAVVLCAAAIAEASEEKILILGERVTDPETGAEGRRILNPKGVVQLTFTNSGLQLVYETESGKVQTVKLTAEFPQNLKEPSSEGEKMYNDIMTESVKENGRVMAGHLLRNTAQGHTANNATLQISLETSRPGFAITDFSYKEVMVHTTSGSLPLSQAVLNTLSMQANQRVEQIMVARAEAAKQNAPPAQAEAAVPTKNPIGFIWSAQPGAASAVRACELMFKATGS